MSNIFDDSEMFTSAASAMHYIANYIRSASSDDLKWCKIGTFGIYIGDPGSRYGFTCKNGGYDLFSALHWNDIPTVVNTGYTDIVETKKAAKIVTGAFPNVTVHIRAGMHAKYVLLSNGFGMIGSANVGDSHWMDISIVGHLSADGYNRLNVLP